MGRAVKVVLTASQPWRRELCGAVGELCRIPGKFAVAVDIALGAAARYVVAENEGAAKQAISYLKEKKAGRTTFLPLDTLRNRTRTADEERAASEKGILGFASDVITYEEKYKTVFTSLLGKTLLADTMDTGSTVAKKYGHRLRIVCLDGTQFNAGGSLTGGSTRNQEGSLISRRALMEDLQQHLDDGQKKLQALTEKGKDLRQAAEEGKKALEEAEEALQKAKQESGQAAWQAAQLAKELRDLEKTVTDMDQRVEALDTARSDIQADLVSKEKALSALEEEPETDIHQWQAAADAAKAEAERCRKNLTECQITARP